MYSMMCGEVKRKRFLVVYSAGSLDYAYVSAKERTRSPGRQLDVRGDRSRAAPCALCLSTCVSPVQKRGECSIKLWSESARGMAEPLKVSDGPKRGEPVCKPS